MTLMKQLKLVRRASAVTRYHTELTTRRDTVGAHTFNMLALTMLLYPYPPVPAELLIHILAHDLGEVVVGDVPAPAKWAHVDLKIALERAEKASNPMAAVLSTLPALETHDLEWLRWVDAFEAMLFILEEAELGNRTTLLDGFWVLYRRLRDSAPAHRLKDLVHETGKCMDRLTQGAHL